MYICQWVFLTSRSFSTFDLKVKFPSNFQVNVRINRKMWTVHLNPHYANIRSRDKRQTSAKQTSCGKLRQCKCLFPEGYSLSFMCICKIFSTQVLQLHNKMQINCMTTFTSEQVDDVTNCSVLFSQPWQCDGTLKLNQLNIITPSFMSLIHWFMWNYSL